MSLWADVLFADGLWAPGLWATDVVDGVPDLAGFTYAEAALILADLGLLLAGGPFLGRILGQTPLAGTPIELGETITVTEETQRVYGVNVGDMQPEDVVVNGPPMAVQLVITPGITRLQVLQAITALTNYLNSRKFPS